MVTPQERKACILAVLVLIVWAVYFVVSAEPMGAPFLYAEL